MNRFQVKKVAVLGAGVMGAQIAAHLVNVKVPVVLFDLPAKEGPKNGIVTRAIDNLKKLKPSPLGVASDAELIGQANYEEHMEQLRDCDLIIEAIAERMDWKLDLYSKIAPFLAPHAIVASMPAMPMRLAMKFGVSLARTTPLPRPLVTKASRSSSTWGSVVGVAISSPSVM
jgi:3-hydroxyacyl-CoA dehydrogenase